MPPTWSTWSPVSSLGKGVKKYKVKLIFAFAKIFFYHFPKVTFFNLENVTSARMFGGICERSVSIKWSS